MKKRAFTLIELLIVLALLSIAAMILFPVFARRPPQHKSSCPSHLKQIGLGFLQYSQDYDGRLSRIATNVVASGGAPFPQSDGWANAIYPYVKSVQLFQCPADSSWRPPSSGSTAVNSTSYWLNSNAAGRDLRDFEAKSLTILSGDGNGGSDIADARYNLDMLPQNWLNDGNSPAFRHFDGANYLFADGHVKWLKPIEISIESVHSGRATFSVH